MYDYFIVGAFVLGERGDFVWVDSFLFPSVHILLYQKIKRAFAITWHLAAGNFLLFLNHRAIWTKLTGWSSFIIVPNDLVTLPRWPPWFLIDWKIEFGWNETKFVPNSSWVVPFKKVWPLTQSVNQDRYHSWLCNLRLSSVIFKQFYCSVLLKV